MSSRQTPRPSPDPFAVDGRGWCSGARRVESPHFDARPHGSAIELVVIHGISLPQGCFGGDGIRQLFTGTLDVAAHPSYGSLAGVRVSAHFVIDRAGAVAQYVSCLHRAWHAGASSFEGRTACNDYSIGIELEGSDDTPYEDAQYRALSELLNALRAAYPLRALRGHCHVAPRRKTDPGPHFDWSRLAASTGRAWNLPV